MKKILLFHAIFFILFSGAEIFSQSFTSDGYGKTEDASRTDALKEMSLTLCSSVQASENLKESYVETEKNGRNRNDSMKNMEIRVLVNSDMPVYGAVFKTTETGEKGDRRFKTTASISASKSVPLYENEVKKTVEKINLRLKGISKLSGSKEESEWQLLAADYGFLDKLETILSIFNAKPEAEPELNPADFRIKAERRAKEITSVEKAGKAVADSVRLNLKSGKKRIYVYPALFEGENTPSEFSVLLSKAVKAGLSENLALTKADSDSYLKGTYYFAPGDSSGKDLILNYFLCAGDGAVLAASGLIKIPEKVYGQYKYVPGDYDLHKEIAGGRVSNPDFDVSLRVNGDRNGLEFKTGESLIVEVRASSSCYIYVTGHVYNEGNEPFSYLFPLDVNADGKEMFVRKISAKEAGSWVVLNPSVDGEPLDIEVMPPFGEETLQVFASTTSDFDDFVSNVPSYIETDDFYLLSGSPAENVSKTRALNVKRVASKASKIVNTAENTVSYMTHR